VAAARLSAGFINRDERLVNHIRYKQVTFTRHSGEIGVFSEGDWHAHPGKCIFQAEV
jgi:hypothetical protein